jgi:hypothetical protein
VSVFEKYSSDTSACRAAYAHSKTPVNKSTPAATYVEARDIGMRP